MVHLIYHRFCQFLANPPHLLKDPVANWEVASKMLSSAEYVSLLTTKVFLLFSVFIEQLAYPPFSLSTALTGYILRTQL